MHRFDTSIYLGEMWVLCTSFLFGFSSLFSFFPPPFSSPCIRLCDIKFVSDVLEARKEQGKRLAGRANWRAVVVHERDTPCREVSLAELSWWCHACVCMPAPAQQVSELGTAHRLAPFPSLHVMLCFLVVECTLCFFSSSSCLVPR